MYVINIISGVFMFIEFLSVFLLLNLVLVYKMLSKIDLNSPIILEEIKNYELSVYNNNLMKNAKKLEIINLKSVKL